MFSGLVAAVGEVAAVRPLGGGLRLEILGRLPGEPLVVGESVAVQGACLTVVDARADGFAAEVSAETVRRTTLGRLRRGARVNLERALRLADRLGGHLVLGHVDATARVMAVQVATPFATMRLALPGALVPEVAEKGSVAVDGVSLTVAAVSDGWFEAALIPQTLQASTLGERRPGEDVNLETDVLAKYVRRCVEGRGAGLAALLEGMAGAAR